MVGTVQDITERKQAEEALKEINLLNQLELAVREVLATQTSLPTALQECCAVVVRALDGAFARIWTLNQGGAVLELQASAGLYTHIDGSHRQVPVGQYKIGRIAAEKQPLLTNNVIGDPSVHDQDWAKKEGMVAFAGYPLLVEDRLLGVMACSPGIHFQMWPSGGWPGSQIESRSASSASEPKTSGRTCMLNSPNPRRWSPSVAWPGASLTTSAT